MGRSQVARILAYLLVISVAVFGSVRAQSAYDLARAVDHRGDVRACSQENLIRTESNRRDASLERTAKLVVRSLNVISKADRPSADRGTNAKLRRIAAEARLVRTQFAPAKLTNCKKQFPAP